jgi:hypothetical protein
MKPQFNQSKHGKNMQPLSLTSMKTQAFAKSKSLFRLLFLIKSVVIWKPFDLC